jgi:peptide/nickel transport system permease protein
VAPGCGHLVITTPATARPIRHRHRSTGRLRCLLAFVLRRVIFAAACVVAVVVIAYGMMRVLRPELYPGEGLLEGTWSDLDRTLLHFEFGGACMFVGCPPIRDLWMRGYGADLWLLGGAFVIGIAGGVAGGVWCAMRPRTLSARLLEAGAMLLYCTPVYVMGLALLLVFNPVFGAVALPWFFDPNSYASPLESPWDWFRSLLFPWLIVAAPLGAACLRLTLAGIVDALDEDYVRTGVAKGVRRRDVVRRHAAPASYPSVASLVGISVPTIVTNMVLVEWVFSVPGFFRHTKRAIGKAVPPVIDIPTLQALALWAAVIIVVVSLLADLALARLDPRVRTAGRPPV